MSSEDEERGAYARSLIGCWELIRREDRNAAGDVCVDAGLGADPIGVLVYDASGRFSVQFMRRDRFVEPAPPASTTRSGLNNTRSVNGYDAYFGRYTVDEPTRTVTQTLEGALAPDNVGVVVTRPMEVDGDLLTLRLSTTDAGGEPIVRTLQWRRCQ